MLQLSKRLCLCALLVGGSGQAQTLGAEPAGDAVTLPSPIEADRAAAIARESTGGRVLDVRLLADDNGPAYAVRLLLNPGRVRTVLVDGTSGQLH